jgi:hypothetical protein
MTEVTQRQCANIVGSRWERSDGSLPEALAEQVDVSRGALVQVEQRRGNPSTGRRAEGR